MDGRYIHRNVKGEIIKVEDILYTCSLEELQITSPDCLVVFSKDVTDQPYMKILNTKKDGKLVTFFKRDMVQKSISRFSQLLFRYSSFKDDGAKVKIATSAMIEYLDIENLNITPMAEGSAPRALDYKTIEQYTNKQEINNIVIYSFDMIIGMNNRIERRTLNPDSMTFTKTNTALIDFSSKIILEVEDHVDIYSIGNDKEIDVIRWDDFDNPITLLPEEFDKNI